MSNEGPQAFIFPLFYGQQARRETLVPLSSNEVINEQLTKLFKRTHCTRRYLTKPHSRWPFESGREDSTLNLIWNSLKMHCGLESSNVIKGSHAPSYESKDGILNFGGKW